MSKRTSIPAVFLGCALAVGCLWGASRADAAPSSGRARCPTITDPARLIPEDARGALHLDGRKTWRSRVYKDLRTALDRDLEAKEGLNMLDACGIVLDDIEAVTVGVASGERSMAVVQGRGVGDAKALECVRARIAARKDGQSPWTSRREGCMQVLSQDGKDFGFVLDDATLVVAAPDWGDEVRALIEGRGKTAIDGPLGTTIAGLDRRQSMWFGWSLDDTDRSQLSGSAAAELRSLGGALDLVRGVDMSARLELADPGGALRLRDELIGYRDMVAGLGVFPADLADKLTIDARANHVALVLALSLSDIERLRKALEPYTQGKNPL